MTNSVEFHKLVWHSMLEAELSSLYWSKMVRKYRFRDKVLKFVLAATTASSVAGWGIWSDYPILWRSLMGASALLAVAQPFLGYAEQIEKISTVLGTWTLLGAEYSYLWDNVLGLNADEARRAFERLRAREVDLAVREGELEFDNRKLREYCTQEVIETALIKRGEK